MMFKKTLALFDSGRLAKSAWFFGCMVLGIAAITGMAWAHCGLESGHQKCHASGGAIDTCAAEQGVSK